MSAPSRPAVAREQFFELVADVRPELHRFCARMTGSLSDGEDIVQDTLLRAYDAMSELGGVPPLRPWLFRIARNRAIDHRRSYDHRMRDSFDGDHEGVSDGDPQEALAHEEAVRAALSWFIELPAAQRCCVILKDVLRHSVDEIAALTELSVPAVKAALHRGRARLREVQRRALIEPAPPRTGSPMIERYAALFNARDWHGVRALLADDVRLDVLGRIQRTGKATVGDYFTNYHRHAGWRVAAAWLDGREVLAVLQEDGSCSPYFIELAATEGRITSIRDFRYVAYIANEARFEGLDGQPMRW